MLKEIVTLLILTVVCRGLIEEHGQDLMAIIDAGFAFFDKDSDGFITQVEFSSFVDDEDLNHDGFITLEEYMSYFKIGREVAEPIFATMDPDGDGQIANDAMKHGVDVMDTNNDGKVSLHEYEHFQKGFLQCVFSEHGNHGHGHDCNNWHHL